MDLVKKGLVLSLIIGVFSLLTTVTVWAAGYNVGLQYIDAGLTPHGGYTTSTNKCKECHAVHLATGSYRLMRVNNASEACDFCHSNTGYASYITQVTMNANGHGLDSNNTDPLIAPDDTTPTPYSIAKSSWGCGSCHSVHANPERIVQLADEPSTMLLLADPDPAKNGSYFYYNTSLINASTRQTPQKLSAWCSACHNADMGSHKSAKQALDKNGNTIIAYGHETNETSATFDANGFVKNVNPDDGVNNGPNCKQCHPASGGNYPHSGSAPNMLMSAAKDGTVLKSDKTNLDLVCISCHNTSSLQ